MQDKGWLDFVETEGWDLTLEQTGLIHKMNAQTSVLVKDLRRMRQAGITIFALVVGMSILEADQVMIYETYRSLMAVCVGYIFSRFLSYNRAHTQKIELRAQLMKTEPPLPGSPGYVEPEPEPKQSEEEATQ